MLAGLHDGVYDFDAIFGRGRGLGLNFGLLATTPDSRTFQEVDERAQLLTAEAIVADLLLIRDHDLGSHPGLQKLYEQMPDRLLRTTFPILQGPVRRLLEAFDLGPFMSPFGTTTFQKDVFARGRE